MKIKLPTGMNGFVLSYYEPEWVKPVEHLVMAGDVVAKVEARAIDGAYMVKAAKINVYGGPKKSTEILGHITHGHVIHPIAMEVRTTAMRKPAASTVALATDSHTRVLVLSLGIRALQTQSRH